VLAHAQPLTALPHRPLALPLGRAWIDDKTIQGILRRRNVGLTMIVYVKSVSESQVSAMDALSEKFDATGEMCNVRATPGQDRPCENCNALETKEILEPRPGLEPGTCRLRIDCSTN
jgi:hypothetical protein